MLRPITATELKNLKFKLKGRRAALTDKEVRSLRPAQPGQRYDIADPGQERFGVRVNDKGKTTYILTARFPGSSNPTRREVPGTTLAEARATAERWLELIEKGIDPKTEIKRQAELIEQAR